MRVTSQPIATWDAFFKEFEKKRTSGKHWVFRGLPSKKGSDLKSSLERSREYFGLDPKDLLWVEGGLIRKFKRHYFHYSPDAPEQTDYIEWLALMRHHGVLLPDY